MAEAIVRTATAEREDRLFPGDPQQFVLGGLGFAYGAAGVLWTLSVTGAGRYPEYEEWLLRAVDRAERSRPGFFDGLHGVAYVLDYLGYDKPALSLVEQAEPLVRMMGDVSVFSGLAGVGLNLLHLGTRNEAGAFTDQALNIADRLADAVRSCEPHGVDVRIASSATGYREAGSNAGLLRGWSGVALFFVRLYEHTGDPAYLEVARRALYRDLTSASRRPTARSSSTVASALFPTLRSVAAASRSPPLSSWRIVTMSGCVPPFRPSSTPAGPSSPSRAACSTGGPGSWPSWRTYPAASRSLPGVR